MTGILGRFVRVDIFAEGEGERLGYAWGLGIANDDYNFLTLYTRSGRVKDEAHTDGRIELSSDEIETAVDADTVRTPAHVYATLAKYQLTGVNDFVKGS